ncbi:peptidyl-tRNA hydrolase PTH2-domain-containing protein [Umbelopsis sp. AD052]|nr:peptidyl-tRNA hydrolase PTH2-domain-containing protein [Umbelopsis sp. AD052]
MLDNWKQSFTLYELGIVSSVALISGYFLGKAYKLRIQATQDLKEESDDEEEFSSEAGSIDASQFNNFKLVLVVRTDLGMTKGKIAAQCGHATLACYKSTMRTNPSMIHRWEHTGQAKVALRCDSEEQMLELQALAASIGLTARSIQDAGRTQIEAGSRTVLGIGPGPVDMVNQITGHLKLL